MNIQGLDLTNALNKMADVSSASGSRHEMSMTSMSQQNSREEFDKNKIQHMILSEMQTMRKEVSNRVVGVAGYNTRTKVPAGPANNSILKHKKS